MPTNTEPTPGSGRRQKLPTTADVYQVALLAYPHEEQDEVVNSGSATKDDRSPNQHGNRAPPGEEGDVRLVRVDTLGDQGEGIAKVEQGFIVIVPGTQPGDKADLEIEDVKESAAFAGLVSEPEVR